MRRVLGNFSLLLRGRGIAAVMLLATTALMARALGPAEFGLVILMQTYVLLIRGLLNFKQFLAIIRYGVPAYDANDKRTLRRLIWISRQIDRYTSVIATLVAVIIAPLVGPMMGLDHDQVMLLMAYSLVLLSSRNVTAVGILRLLDRFDILGTKETIGPCVRLVGVALAWWLEGPFAVFIAIMAFAYVSENFYVIWCGNREYFRHIGATPEGEDNSDASMAEFTGLRHFLWITYWQSNIDLIPKHVSILMAGYFMGPVEAGLLRLARQFSTLLAKPAILIRQVVFLDLTRSWNQGSTDFKLVAYRTALIGGGIGLLFALAGYFFGEAILGTIIGEEFVGAAPVLTLLLLAATFELIASSLRAATYAIGHAAKVLRLSVVSAVIYLTLFSVLTSEMGLIGAGVAACVAAILPPLVMAILIHRSDPASTS